LFLLARSLARGFLTQGPSFKIKTVIFTFKLSSIIQIFVDLIRWRRKPKLRKPKLLSPNPSPSRSLSLLQLLVQAVLPLTLRTLVSQAVLLLVSQAALLLVSQAVLRRPLALLPTTISATTSMLAFLQI
jgi:hypothetical protein